MRDPFEEQTTAERGKLLLQKQAAITQRASLGQIASFLGMTLE